MLSSHIEVCAAAHQMAIDEADEFAAEVDRRAEQLLTKGQQFYPLDASVIADAVSDAWGAAFWDRIASMLESGESVNDYIKQVAKAYAKKQAHDDAEIECIKEWEQGGKYDL